MPAVGPVLAVVPNVLDTPDALKLWSLFSKSKDTLQDGPRLEYISWRLAFQQISRNSSLRTPLDAPWPPTPESVCSDDTGGSKSTHSHNSGTSSENSAASVSPFFQIAPRPPMPPPQRSAGRIIRDIVTPGFTQKLIQPQKDSKKQPPKDGYPTPASSDSASSSGVSIAVSPADDTLEPAVPVPRVNIVTATPNLTPHPTPPATPLLAASAPVPARALSPSSSVRLSTPPSPTVSSQMRRDPPGPFFLPRSATRGMGSPISPPADSASARTDTSAHAPKSTHNLPLGGTEAAAKKTPRGTFYLEPAASGSSPSSSRSSNSYDNDGEHGSDSPSSGSRSGGSESSRERGEGSSSFVHGPERGGGNTRGRARVQRATNGRRSPDAPPETHEASTQPAIPQQVASAKHVQQQQRPLVPKPTRSASTSLLGGLGLGLEMTASPQSNGRHATDPDRDDARSVSSLTTSSSHVQVRVRGKPAARPSMRSQQSRSRSRKGGTRAASRGHGHAREGSTAHRVQREAPNTLGLPSDLAAAVAVVERTMVNGRRVEVATTTDEEWSDDEDESMVDGASVGGEMEEEEVEEADEEEGGWEDEDESEPALDVAKNAKAPPPSLQQQQPAPNLGHTRGNSTDLRQLPSRPHRSAGHLPALANAAPTKHHHTASAQNARTTRALNATMSATTLSSAMHEAQRQRQLFAKAPRHSYENLTALAGTRPSGLTLLLGGRQRVAEQYHQEQHQLQQQIEGRPPQRQSRPGGLAGLGLMMSAARPPTAAGGAELSPIPPTPATAAVQQQHHQQPPAPRRQSQLPPAPPQQKSPAQPQQQSQAGPPPRRPNMPRAMSTPHFGTGMSGSVGKSSVAGPVVSGLGDGPDLVAPPATGGSTTTQNGSASGRSGYRPKGPPAGMEYDDEEDDEEDAEGRGKGKGRAHDEGMQVSKSVAQEKLRVLAQRTSLSSRAKNGSGGMNGVESTEAERRRLYEEAGDAPWVAAPNANDDYVPQPPPDRSMPTAPVGFPYNLPAPALPSTPRTTRQHMLLNEMSESLRHNLLWQRRLSRTDMTGPPPRRTKSTVNVTTAQGGRQPEKSVVRVTPRAPGAERRDTTLPPLDPPVPAVAPKKKLVRNYSMGDTSTYHYSGW
ncbi:hypothetical protein B0H16DRAFT_1617066 [Mycena metata]|uniref:Nitrogen regulatory protein areA GATA-like domain-containing protein n=1 Tax=Mycena metata TaxID=1033252 RepID=A0AAD7MFJ6_9AGAR|nr:hypothetical protein B0H16DRAFT_1617066 [Mycena metata]